MVNSFSACKMTPSNNLFYLFLVSFFSLVLIGQASAKEMVDFPVVKLQSLDKVTARTMTFEASTGSTVKFGPLYIKVQTCRKAPPVEQPESAAFLQIWEINSEEKAEWVFSGWMFASSPGLSSMDHPIYDVWVLDCLEEKTVRDKEQEEEEIKRGEGEITEDEVPKKPREKMESR